VTVNNVFVQKACMCEKQKSVDAYRCPRQVTVQICAGLTPR
jgi:hypothetical protein